LNQEHEEKVEKDKLEEKTEMIPADALLSDMQ